MAQAALDEGGAQDVLTIPLKGKSLLADYMIIASGTSARQIAALAERLRKALKKHTKTRSHIEGLPDANWVIVDAGDVIIHLFRPEVRDYYRIEALWENEKPASSKTRLTE